MEGICLVYNYTSNKTVAQSKKTMILILIPGFFNLCKAIANTRENFSYIINPDSFCRGL
jgi:hypothetical protein